MLYETKYDSYIAKMLQIAYSVFKNILEFRCDFRSVCPVCMNVGLYFSRRQICSPILQSPLVNCSNSNLMIAVSIRLAASAPHSDLYAWLTHPNIVIVSLSTHIKSILNRIVNFSVCIMAAGARKLEDMNKAQKHLNERNVQHISINSVS